MKISKLALQWMIVILFLISFQKSYAQTQQSMTADAVKSYKEADVELNIVYQKICKDYARQPKFIKKFKIAQHLWVRLRDAELAAKYPDNGTYGSVESMCKNAYITSLTRDRTKFLKIWLTGLEEGNVCLGSVKKK